MKTNMYIVFLFIISFKLAFSMEDIDIREREISPQFVEVDSHFADEIKKIKRNFINHHLGNLNTEQIHDDYLDYYVENIIKTSEQYDPHRYGGPKAWQFFASAEPLVLDFINDYIKRLSQNLSYREDHLSYIKFHFNELINRIGLERAKIAVLTGTKDSHLFGSRGFNQENPLLNDTFIKDMPPWPAWYEAISSKVRKIVSGKESEMFESARKAPNHLTTIEDNNIALDLYAVDTMKYFVYLRHKNDPNYLQTFSGPRENHRLNSQAAAYFWESLRTLPGSIVPFGFKNNWLKGQPITCYHRHHSTSVVEDGLQDFTDIILWNKGPENDDQLVGLFASLLWKMAHSSTYLRGQASLTKWLLVGLAKAIGYQLTFVPATDPKYAHLPEDQQALSELDRQTFIKDCISNKCIKLVRIGEFIDYKQKLHTQNEVSSNILSKPRVVPDHLQQHNSSDLTSPIVSSTPPSKPKEVKSHRLQQQNPSKSNSPRVSSAVPYEQKSVSKLKQMFERN